MNMLICANILFNIIFAILGPILCQKIGFFSTNLSLISDLKNLNSSFTAFYVNSADLFILKQLVCQENFEILIFDSLSAESEAKLTGLTKFFQIPVLWISKRWRRGRSTVNTNSIIFQHSIFDVAKVIGDYISNYNLIETVLVGDDTSKELFSVILNRIKSNRVTFIFKTVFEEKNCSSNIQRILVETKWKLQFIVLISPMVIQTILQNALKCGFMLPDVTWVILNSCWSDLRINVPEYSLLKLVSFYDKNDANSINSGCIFKKSEDIIKIVSRNYFNFDNSSLLGNLTENQCGKRNIFINSSSMVYKLQNMRAFFDTNDEGFLKVNRFVIQQLKAINGSSSLLIPSNLPNEIKVYKNVSINICIRKAPTLYANISKADSLTFVSLILNHFYENFNFNWTIIEPQTGHYFECVDKLVKDQVDLSVDFTSIIDTGHLPILLWTVLEEEHCFILGIDPDNKGVTLWAPVQFFHWTFILLLGGCLLLYSIMALVYSRFSNIVPTSNSTWPPITNSTTFLDLCWNFCGSFLMQGLEYNPLNPSLSTLSFFWWVYAIIISSVYSGSLTVTMTVSNNKYNYLPNSIYELLQIEKVDVFIVQNSYIDMWLNNSTESIYNLLKAQRIYVSSLDECFNKVLDNIKYNMPNLAVCLSPCINTMRREDTCNRSRVLTDTLFPLQISMAFNPMLPWKNFMISQLAEMKDNGKLEHLRHNSTAEVICLPVNQNDQYSGDSIGKEGLYGVIFIIYALFVLGILSLGVELLFIRYKRKKCPQKTDENK